MFEVAAHGVQLGEEEVEGRDGVLVGAGVFDELLRADDRLGDRGGAINGRSDIDDRAADLAAQVAGPARVVDNVLRSISRLRCLLCRSEHAGAQPPGEGLASFIASRLEDGEGRGGRLPDR